MTYECNIVCKIITLDNFENGLTDSGRDVSYSHRIAGDSLPVLVDAIASHTGCNRADVIVGEIEPDRIDVSIMENAEGYRASEREMEAFSRGECQLWQADYSFYFSEVTRTPANFNTTETI